MPRSFAWVILIALVSCSGKTDSLTQIQQQRAGDYVLTLFNDSGVVKQRSNRLTLEVRNAASNALTPVNNLQIQSSMRMPGMGPMFGDVTSLKEIAPGKYEFNAEFSMAGQWNFLVTFDPNVRVQFNLNAQ